VDIKTFKLVAPLLPADIAILMRGPTGVGKSHLAKAVAAETGLPFIDVRGSTMSEGDVGGYPDVAGMAETGVMTFCMPSWFMRACKEPVLLMLDELNRSLPGVQQSFFQLVLDRELGNDKTGTPYRLHPGTRVIAAVNCGSEYDVNDMDPALLRRFYVCDLEPTNEDWLEWAGDAGIDRVLMDFIRQEPAHLRVDPSSVEPGTICPNPASWDRLNGTLVHANLAPSDVCGTTPPGFYALSLGFVGTEAAISFVDFVKNYEKVVSAEDVLAGRVASGEDFEASVVANVVDKLAVHCKENKWSAKECGKVAKFAKTLSGEMLVMLWNKVSSTQNLENIQKLHKLLGKEVVRIVQASRNKS
jgi:hypothetical protein